MSKQKPLANKTILRKLRAYSVLDNGIRLKIFSTVHDSPSVSFNVLARLLKLETGLLAYHIALLKASDLVNVSYEREGKDTSHYSISDEGAQIYDELFNDKKVLDPIGQPDRSRLRVAKTSLNGRKRH
jgi:predicted transcriptional regulator